MRWFRRRRAPAPRADAEVLAYLKATRELIARQSAAADLWDTAVDAAQYRGGPVEALGRRQLRLFIRE
ncbi:MAG TPA: hypothetical protein QF624_00615 [Dehalococcoidia bacterium]|nr:hypothetical protein [Dehalococcoidia bacterium]